MSHFGGFFMKMNDIKEVARKMGIRPGKMTKGELIHTIQTTEGNPACYNTGQAVTCGQSDCAWRDDCDRP
jgi:hypothetical protein